MSKQLLSLLGSALLVLGCQADGEPDSAADSVQEIRSELPRKTKFLVDDEQYARVLAAVEGLGLEVLKVVGADGKNVAVSPFSLGQVLGMVSLGSEGETQQQLHGVLGAGLTAEQIQSAINRQATELEAAKIPARVSSSGVPTEVSIGLAAGVWVDDEAQVRSEYLDGLASYYGVGVQLSDLGGVRAAEAINDWVAGETNGQVPGLLEGSLPVNTTFLGVSVLALGATWATPFDKASTLGRPFTRLDDTVVSAPMMSGLIRSRYAAGEGWQLVELAYTGGELGLTLVLPEPGLFEALRGELTEAWFAEARAQAISTDVELTLPVFEIDGSNLDLGTVVGSLGVVDAFQCGRADFGGLLTDAAGVCLQQLVQRNAVMIDEVGTRAVSATAVVGVSVDLPPSSPPTAIFDRPFLFSLGSGQGSVLFVGQVTDPTTER